MRPLVFIVVLLTRAVPGASSEAPSVSAPGGQASPGAEAAPRPIAGRTPAEWREWFKQIDFSQSRLAEEVPALVELLREDSAPPIVRQQAAHTLGRIGPAAAAAVPVLIDLLDETEPAPDAGSPRQWSLKAIALMGGPARDAAPRIIRLLRDPTTMHLDRLLALEALGRIGAAHPQTLGAIVAVAERPLRTEPAARLEDLELKTAAVDVLSLFGASAAPAIPLLQELTRGDHEPLRRAAVNTLGKTGNPLVLEALVDALLFDPSPVVCDTAAVALSQLGGAAVPTLQALLVHRDAEVRARAAEALGRIGPPAAAALASLRERLTDPAPGVRLAAAEGIWRLTGSADGCLDAPLALLAEPQRELRMRAQRLLVEIGRSSRSPELLARLEELAASRNPQVRQAAYLALRELRQPVP
jgi:HEAT repeat protein